ARARSRACEASPPGPRAACCPIVTASRVEPLHRPPRAVALVREAIVEPRGAREPELDSIRHEAVATPVGRPRDGARVARVDLLHARLELLARRERSTLLGGPRPDLALARPRREICVRFGVVDLLDAALDAHLLPRRGPVRAERRER